MKLFLPIAMIFSALFFNASTALAWGGRGHHTICDAATFLVKNDELRAFLTQRPQMMGHLCNVPDIYWKSLSGVVISIGSPTHYIDPEVLGLPIDQVPLDFAKIITDYTGKIDATSKDRKIIDIPSELGSIWWRVDDLQKMAVQLGDKIKAVPAPANRNEEQNDNLEYNKLIYQYFIITGVMGHYVGDSSQPLHSSSNYDGWDNGHGGLHSFYEDAGVSAQPYNLHAKIVEQGMKYQKLAEANRKTMKPNSDLAFLNSATTLEKMRAMTLIANKELKGVEKIDPVTKPSVLKEEKGMRIKTVAERKPVESVAKEFGVLIVKEMGRSAALLAQLWDETYIQIGTPKLAAYKSYKYPFTPEFIRPSYVPEAVKKEK